MTTHEQHIAQKKKEIEEISKLQTRLIKKAAAIVADPSKRIAAYRRRINRMMTLVAQARALEIQKQIILSRPIPANGFVPGCSAIVGESGPEVIKVGNLTIYPTPLVDRDSIIMISESRPIDENYLKNLDLVSKSWLRSEGAAQEVTITNTGKAEV